MLLRNFVRLFLGLSLLLIASCGGDPVTRTSTSIGTLPVNPYSSAADPYASTPVTTTPAITLTPVLGLHVAEDANVAGTLNLTWQPVVDAISYEVVWNGMVLNATTENYTFTGLSDGSIHTFTVRARNGTVFGSPASVTKTVGLLGTIAITGTLPYALDGATVTAYWNGNVPMGSVVSVAGAYTLNVNLTRNVNLNPATIVIKSVGGTGVGLAPISAPTFAALIGKVDPSLAIPSSLSGNMDEATTVLYGYLTSINGSHLSQSDAAFYQSWLDTNVLLGKSGYTSDLLGMITLYASYMNKNIPSAWATRDLPIFASSMVAEGDRLLLLFNYVKITGSPFTLDSAVVAGTPAFDPTAVLTPLVTSALPPQDASFAFAGAPQLRLSNLRKVGSFIDTGGVPNLAPPTITASAGNGSINVTWAGVIGATGYNVYLNGALVGNVTQSPYSFTGLNNGQSYQVGVTTLGLAGESQSALATVVPVAVPFTPTGLTVSYDNATQVIALNWNAAVGASSYDVKLNGVLVATGQQQTSFTYGGAVIGTTYVFDVLATNASGQSLPANVTIVPAIALSTPTGLTATPQANGDVFVTWNPVPNATGYSVTVDYGVSIVNTTANSATVVGLTRAVPHVLEVSATVGGVVSPPATVNVTVPLPAPLPAPAALNAATLTSTSIRLVWSAVVGAASYNVSVNGLVSNVATTTFDAGGLTGGLSVPISVSAVDANGTAGAAITVNTAPAPSITLSPVNLIDTNVTVGSPDAILSWVITDPSGLSATYNGYIALQLDAGSPIPLSASATTYTLVGLTVGTHTITVTQCNDAGCGAAASLVGVFPH